jgi:hypothetical protein
MVSYDNKASHRAAPHLGRSREASWIRPLIEGGGCPMTKLAATRDSAEALDYARAMILIAHRRSRAVPTSWRCQADSAIRYTLGFTLAFILHAQQQLVWRRTEMRGEEVEVAHGEPDEDVRNVPRARGPVIPRGAYSIAEFCIAHRISSAMYFKLKQQGFAPVEMRCGKRVLISIEAAAAWRRTREAAAGAPPEPLGKY